MVEGNRFRLGGTAKEGSRGAEQEGGEMCSGENASEPHGSSSGPTERCELNGHDVPQCQSDLWLEGHQKSCLRTFRTTDSDTSGTNDSLCT